MQNNGNTSKPKPIDSAKQSSHRKYDGYGADDRISPSTLSKMQRDMRDFCYLLLEDEFDAETSFKELFNYIKTHKRILYSTVSFVVYELQNDNEKSGMGDDESGGFDALSTRIALLVEYVEKDENISKHKNAADDSDKNLVTDTKYAVYKLYDHINLASVQFNTLKQSDAEYDKKFKQRIEKTQNSMVHEMQSQFIGIVAIFTTLAFLLFGGINSLSEVLSGLNESHLLRLMIVACVWGLGMLNSTFVLILFIGKLTNVEMKSDTSSSARLWEKYPIVFFSDYALVSIMIVLMWLHYCVNRNANSFLDWLIGLNPAIVGTIGMILIIGAIVMGFVVIYKPFKKKDKE